MPEIVPDSLLAFDITNNRRVLSRWVNGVREDIIDPTEEQMEAQREKESGFWYQAVAKRRDAEMEVESAKRRAAKDAEVYLPPPQDGESPT